MIDKVVLSILGLSIFVRLLATRFFLVPLAVPDMHMLELLDAKANMIAASLPLFAAALFLLKAIFKRDNACGMPAGKIAFLYFIICAATFFYSVDKNQTLKALLILFSNISCFCMLINLLNSEYRRRLFIMLLIGAALFAALLGIIHYFLILSGALKAYSGYITSDVVAHMLKIGRITSVFGWPLVFAGFLILVMPVSAACIFQANNERERAATAMAFLAILLAMLFTFSIIAWLSLSAAFFITGFVYLRKKPAAFDKKYVPWAMIAVFACIFIFILLKRANIATLSSLESRLMYIRSVIKMIKVHPFLGSGLDTFRVLCPNFISTGAGYSSYSHNSYLQIWSETGVFGLLSFLIIIIYIFRNAWQGVLSCENSRRSILSYGLFCSGLAFLIDNIGSFTMLAPITSFFWWVYLAIIFAWFSNRQHIQQEKPRTKTGVYIYKALYSCLFVAVILLVVGLFRIYIADTYFYKGIEFFYSGEIDKSVNALKKSEEINPLDGRVALTLGKTYLFLWDYTHKESRLKEAEEEFEKSIRLRPTVASGYAFLGHVYNREKNQKKKAKEYYAIASKLAPYDEQYRSLATAS